MSPSRFHSTLTDALGRKLRNRPYNIQDLADQAGNYAQDIPQMAYQPNGIVDPQDANHTINTANNFSYDALGQRTKDEKAGIELIEWTPNPTLGCARVKEGSRRSA